MENKKNGGTIYRNKKEKPTSPDYTGNLEIDGKKYRLAGWINKSKAGNNYLRLLASEMQEQQPDGILSDLQEVKEAAINNKPETDDLPF
jgi:hypothetical protein